MLTSHAKTFHGTKRDPTNPFDGLIDGFAGWLQETGYAAGTIRGYLSAAAHWSRWAKKRRTSPERWDEEAVAAFGRHVRLQRPRRSKGTSRSSVSAVRCFLRYLRTLGLDVPPEPERRKPIEPSLLVGFRHWSLDHRGISTRTLEDQARFIREFLQAFGEDPSRFDARCLRSFIVDLIGQRGRRSVQHAAYALRMFVRYLIADGKCPAGLEQAVPGVAGWQLSWLPKTLPTADVERVLAACDTSTQKGLRDRALLLLLVRLGLRAQDIIRLRIADIDWAGATLRVSGKGRSEARVPLTQEVGDAILAYLEYGRPRVTDPHLFLRDVAPIGPWATSQRVSLLVRRAIRRSGVVAPSYGAHMLRHTAATEMLRQGASLYEISAVLRHRSIATTAVYAKVDVASLKLVAQPWPEVQ